MSAPDSTPLRNADLGFFANAPRGMGRLLNKELRLLGAHQVEGGEGGVRFRGDLEMGYRACLWSRYASRVMLGLTEVVAADQDALYRAVRSLPWEDHVPVDGTLAISVSACWPTTSRGGAVLRSSTHHSGANAPPARAVRDNR